MHLKQPSFVTTGSKEEFNRNDYSNYHLPEVCPRKEQDPSSARTHALPQGKEASGCVVAPPAPGPQPPLATQDPTVLTVGPAWLGAGPQAPLCLGEKTGATGPPEAVSAFPRELGLCP